MANEIGLVGANALAKQALALGGQRLTLGSTSWDVSGDCESASGVTVSGRFLRGQFYVPENGFSVLHGRVKRQGTPQTIFLQVRCGKCAKCRRLRRRIWTARALEECRRAVRTWLVTLTADTGSHFLYETRARHNGRQRGYDYDTLSESERFGEVCREMGAELTKYVKRVRKESGAKLRAMWVFEAHKSGAPHIHGLVHEVEAIPVTWRCLNAQWKDGFSHEVLLTDPRKSAYAAKYLSKEGLCRVRASRGYGQSKKRPDAIAGHFAPRDFKNVVFQGFEDDYLAHWVRECEAAPGTVQDARGSSERCEERPDPTQSKGVDVRTECEGD